MYAVQPTPLILQHSSILRSTVGTILNKLFLISVNGKFLFLPINPTCFNAVANLFRLPQHSAKTTTLDFIDYNS